MSPTPTQYAVHCTGSANPPNCTPCTSGPIYLTYREYMRQLCKPNDGWKCPKCGSWADWDDGIYEAWEAKKAVELLVLEEQK